MTSTAATGSATRREIASQPEIWERVLAEAPEHSRLLPAPGEPVLFVGCGTSYYVGESYSRLRNSADLGRTRAAIASEIPYVDDDETLVVLSRSGTTSDVADVIREHKANRSTRVIGIVGEAGTPIAELCDHLILLDYADEESVVQTRFASSALLLLRASLGEDLSGLPDAARAALEAPLPEPLPRHVVFLGHDWTIGVAQEAALKCREAAGYWTEAYALMEYQHGPLAVAGEGSLVWCMTETADFVSGPIRETGADVLVPDLDPLAQLVTAHRLAVALAHQQGRDPDHPRHLARSVQLH
ncbi:MAG: SIS domain-containing protein [Nocardioides sp.]|uniref:SIS domain-containing protein n=1 Tax=Nocardioides sp. TaxID=35761 RepID=UPI0039E6453E